MSIDQRDPIQVLDATFKKTCVQLRLLNNWIEHLQVRYDRVASSNKRAQRYSLRIKLCVIEGVRNSFYEHALKLADKLDSLRLQTRLLNESSDDDGDEFVDIELDSSDADEVAQMRPQLLHLTNQIQTVARALEDIEAQRAINGQSVHSRSVQRVTNPTIPTDSIASPSVNSPNRSVDSPYFHLGPAAENQSMDSHDSSINQSSTHSTDYSMVSLSPEDQSESSASNESQSRMSQLQNSDLPSPPHSHDSSSFPSSDASCDT